MSKKILKLPKKIAQVYESRYRDIVEFKDAIVNLTGALEHFQHTIERVRSQNEIFDFEEARRLHGLAARILDLCQKNPEKPFVPFALGAVAYLVMTPDANDDYGSIDGLDDDRDVFKAVIEAFDLQAVLDEGEPKP